MKFHRIRLSFITMIAVFSAAVGGCAVPGSVKPAEAPDVEMEQKISAVQGQLIELSAETEHLRSQLSSSRAEAKQAKREVKALREDLRTINGVREIEARYFARRLAAMEAARDDAVKEVVRTRARIQGMASPAEAAAMFAEARVILDRMKEDAFNEQALDYISQGRRYLQDGRKEMENQNPGGAAYLFDLISTLYESYGGIDSKTLTVSTRMVNLREMPDPSSKKLGVLSRGDKVKGQKKKGDWIQVRTTSGLQGWVHSKYLK